MYSSFSFGWLTSTLLLEPVATFADYAQDSLCNNTMNCLTNTDRPNTWILYRFISWQAIKDERNAGSTKVVHIQPANKAEHNSSEAEWKEEHNLFQPWASMPEGPAAPKVLSAAVHQIDQNV